MRRHKFPTDGDPGEESQKVREPRRRLIRWDSGTDSKVWMGEETEKADNGLRDRPMSPG